MRSIDDCPETVIGCRVDLNSGKPRVKLHADGTMSFLGGDFHNIPEDMLEKIVLRIRNAIKKGADNFAKCRARLGPRPIGGTLRY